MSVHDAELSDIYVDAQGKLWRCVMICHEPTVTFEAVEGYTQPPPGMNQAAAAQAMYIASAPPIIKARQGGGVSGVMWNGWKRIFRSEPGSTEAKGIGNR